MRTTVFTKFVLTMVITFGLARSAFCFSFPCPPTHDWTVPGPGGRYGLVCYPFGTELVFGSHNFWMVSNFKIAAGLVIWVSAITITASRWRARHTQEPGTPSA